MLSETKREILAIVFVMFMLSFKATASEDQKQEAPGGAQAVQNGVVVQDGIPFPLYLYSGDTKLDSGVLFTMKNGSFDMVWKAAGPEEVEVPAGIFHTLKIEYAVMKDESVIFKAYYWYSADNGVVRAAFRDSQAGYDHVNKQTGLIEQDYVYEMKQSGIMIARHEYNQ